MSNNLGQFNSPKTPTWGRTNATQNMVPQNNQGINMPQMMNQSLGNINNAGMLQFQQQHPQVFQSALGLQQQNLGLGLQQMANNAINAAASQLATSNQIFQQVGNVSYPNPRALNTAAFQTPQNLSPMSPQMQVGASGSNSNSGGKQRVFTGTVTKVLDNFGFVDEDVFFQTNACVKGSNPVVGDRVLVEASYNPSMPFKWNATRIQVLSTSVHTQQQSRHSTGSKNYPSGYNAVPPPDGNSGSFRGGNNTNRGKASLGGRGRERSRDRDRDEEEIERKRRREERQREREKEEKKSPVRRVRSRSPKTRRRPRIVPRYMVQIPKITLNSINADVLEVRRRYGNMYVPSDFFYSNFEWVNAFPLNKPFSLSKPCFFHIMNKEIEPIEDQNDAILEPPDADYIFSAKVMLMNVPGMEELYSKCCAMAEDEDKRDGEEKDYIHPSRLINFLVGLRGKNETMAIGGPWSQSLDGPNPDKDPSVLIKTAIRTCKALTGINLSNCTQWYRFTELYYRRAESVHKGKTIPARVETVIIYLPDVWSCLPTRLEWDQLVQSYQKQLERELKTDQEIVLDEIQTSDEKDDETNTGNNGNGNGGGVNEKIEPTHHSLLDLKTMNVNDLKKELKARNVSNKGLRSQLVARLSKLLKTEAEQPNEDDAEMETPTETPSVDDKKTEIEEKKMDEKEKSILIKRYTLPENQHIIVHPSKTAKSGKFDCTVMSLSLLLDYRPEDTKEHSFEVSLFAELFNEMLMRDFGFNIYKTLHNLPDKPKEKDESKKRDKDDKKRKEEDKKKDDDEKEKKEQTEKIDEVKEKDETKSEKSKKSDTEDDDEENNSLEKDKKKEKEKKKNRIKLYTKHKQLLLSFVYFDQTHCGYIFDKDIEDLLYTLGLNLSRAQVKKLVGKVITRDSLHYRKLTDKPKEDENSTNEEIEEIDEHLLKELAAGNRKLLPVFKNNEIENKEVSDIKNESMIMFQGALIDIGKLIAQLERSDKARLETESRIINLKQENTKLIEKYDKTNQSLKRLNSELKDFKEKLRTAEDSLSKTTVHTKLYQAILTEIKDKIDPVLKSTVIKEKIDEGTQRDYEESRCEKDTRPLRKNTKSDESSNEKNQEK